MEKTTINFLGTGNAVPTKLRNHTAILLSYKDENILIDCGEGAQRQFRIAEISPTKLTKILITHWHGDHILGLPGLFQTLAMSEYQNKLQIYGPKGTKQYINELTSLFKEFKINLEVHEGTGKVFENKDFLIEAKEMTHGCPANAYSFIIKDKIRLDKNKLKKLKLPNSPLIGQLASGKDIIFNKKKIRSSQVTYKETGKKITFILDTGMNSNALEIAKNSDILIAESTFSSEEKERAKEYFHLTSEDAAEIAKKSKSKALILTHISQRYEHSLDKIEKEARKVFKNTQIAKDFDVIEL